MIDLFYLLLNSFNFMLWFIPAVVGTIVGFVIRETNIREFYQYSFGHYTAAKWARIGNLTFHYAWAWPLVGIWALGRYVPKAFSALPGLFREFKESRRDSRERRRKVLEYDGADD